MIISNTYVFEKDFKKLCFLKSFFVRHNKTLPRVYMGYINNCEEDEMQVDLIFKIAAIGILVAVLNMLLSKAGRDDQALLCSIAGLVVVLMIVLQEISTLFETVKTLFGF